MGSYVGKCFLDVVRSGARKSVAERSETGDVEERWLPGFAGEFLPEERDYPDASNGAASGLRQSRSLKGCAEPPEGSHWAGR